MAETTDDTKMHELARQLRHPHGDAGTQVGRVMHDSNAGMTHACLASLDSGLDGLPGPHEDLLEIGHGNGMHVDAFLARRARLRYQGLELSALMHQEAIRLNPRPVDAGRAGFAIYDGDRFPFGSASFDAVMSVNTIYFLPEPAAFLAEVHRVLRPGGCLALAFAERDFMQQLPFTRHGFRLYDAPEVHTLLSAARFELQATDRHVEEVPSKAQPGTTTRRLYTVIRASRGSAARQPGDAVAGREPG